MAKEQAQTNSANRAVAQFLDDIFATQPHEIDCDEAEIAIANCAASGLSDEEARRRHRDLFTHFRFCSDCAEEYQMVTTYMRQKAAGQIKQPARIPPVPKLFPVVASVPPPSILDEIGRRIFGPIREGIDQVADAMTPRNLAGAFRSIALSAERKAIPMEGGEVTAIPSVKPETEEPELRRLLCTIKTTNPDLKAKLASASIWVTKEGDDTTLQEHDLNKFGEVTFTKLSPGTYSLHWLLADREFVLPGLEIS